MTDSSMNDIIRKAAGYGTEQPATEADGEGETEARVPDFDGGARRVQPKPVTMNDIIRAALDQR